MALLDVTIVNVALPTIGRSLHASGAALQLVVSGYVVSYAMLLITGARLGDLLGHRNLYLAGLGAFTLASLACGLAPTIAALIGARVVQGAGAALMVPQILSVIQHRFAGPARAPGWRRLPPRWPPMPACCSAWRCTCRQALATARCRPG